MTSIFRKTIAAFAIGAISIATVTPTLAAGPFPKHSTLNEEYRDNNLSWNGNHRYNWSGNHHFSGNSAAATIFGFAAGAIIGGALANQNHVVITSSHAQRCAQEYGSYDPYSDTFLGFDGFRHYCRL